MAFRANCKFTDWLVRPRKEYGPKHIYLPQSDQLVRKLSYCPQSAHVLFVKYSISYAFLHRLKQYNIIINTMKYGISE
jgi:hypothetical protein